jgi:hypothetical protein
MAVTGDLLLIRDSGLLKSFLDATTRVNSGSAFVAVANVERRILSHHFLPLESSG